MVAAPTLAGGPGTKQTGKDALEPFTSICAVPGFASYGNCGGDITTYTNVTGRMTAVQAKPGRYNLGFTFTNLTPGATFRLLGNKSNGEPWFLIGTAVAGASGVAEVRYQTSSPVGLGFDLNLSTPGGDITVVTSYWSGQLLAMNPDGTLYVLPG